MEECLVPSTSDIKVFLKKRRYDLKVGFVCFEIDCQFCNYLKDPKTKNPPQTEGKSVFVNKISGIFRCVFYFILFLKSLYVHLVEFETEYLYYGLQKVILLKYSKICRSVSRCKEQYENPPPPLPLSIVVSLFF